MHRQNFARESVGTAPKKAPLPLGEGRVRMCFIFFKAPLGGCAPACYASCASGGSWCRFLVKANLQSNGVGVYGPLPRWGLQTSRGASSEATSYELTETASFRTSVDGGCIAPAAGDSQEVELKELHACHVRWGRAGSSLPSLAGCVSSLKCNELLL